jgi:hypothetical protein
MPVTEYQELRWYKRIAFLLGSVLLTYEAVGRDAERPYLIGAYLLMMAVVQAVPIQVKLPGQEKEKEESK